VLDLELPLGVAACPLHDGRLDRKLWGLGVERSGVSIMGRLGDGGGAGGARSGGCGS
jgi:hypothetical protein